MAGGAGPPGVTNDGDRALAAPMPRRSAGGDEGEDT